MSISNSVLTELLQFIPNWRPQMYFKSSLTALSHAIEDQVLADNNSPLVIASFQRERFYRQEAHRYRRIANRNNQVYVLSAPETDFKNSSEYYETIAFDFQDALAQEWHLVVIGETYASCLICRERLIAPAKAGNMTMDANRRFEGIWTFERQVSQKAAEIILDRIVIYRPELKEKVEQAKSQFLKLDRPWTIETLPDFNNRSDAFVQRLVTYLQAGQYKLIKANKSLAIKQQRERLLNSITTAIRRSLDTEEILDITTTKLGEGLDVCRCIIYRCHQQDQTATIEHEYVSESSESLRGQTWQLADNPLFAAVVEQKEVINLENTQTDSRAESETVQALVRQGSIISWLLVPVLYKEQLVGMIELHNCQPTVPNWKEEDIRIIEAIATGVGVALIQAEAYANLEELNRQLEALDRTRSNLVAITGHELRTPLSTIQVCLESLASEPDMEPELRQVMLNTALSDTERMRKLIQDFLTLSQLESGRIQWHPEPLSLPECVELAVSNVKARHRRDTLPEIKTALPPKLPLVQADGEWLVQVIAKLLDNSCKFTEADGCITIAAKIKSSDYVKVIITDTGRGIEPSLLEQVFDRFYQEEGALRRSTGGTGLGLAICRQIVGGWGGQIWAESAGKDQGSIFNFTIPAAKQREQNGVKRDSSSSTSTSKTALRQKYRR